MYACCHFYRLSHHQVCFAGSFFVFWCCVTLLISLTIVHTAGSVGMRLIEDAFLLQKSSVFLIWGAGSRFMMIFIFFVFSLYLQKKKNLVSFIQVFFFSFFFLFRFFKKKSLNWYKPNHFIILQNPSYRVSVAGNPPMEGSPSYRQFFVMAVSNSMLSEWQMPAVITVLILKRIVLALPLQKGCSPAQTPQGSASVVGWLHIGDKIIYTCLIL